MKRLNLVNFIFLKSAKFAFPILGALVMIELFSLSYVLKRVDAYETSFENAIIRSNFEIIFAISFVMILCALAATILSFYYSNKSIYTLLQVQRSKNELYYSFLISGIMLVLILWTVQLFVIFLSYEQYSSQFDRGRYMLGNGLFLSFIRYDFFRLFFPLTLNEWLKLIFLITSPVLATLFSVFTILSGEIKKLLILIPWVLVLRAFTSSFRTTGNESGFWTGVGIIIAIIACINFYVSGKNLLSNKSIT